MLGVLHTAKQYRGSSCYHQGSNKEHVCMYLISELRNKISPVQLVVSLNYRYKKENIFMLVSFFTLFGRQQKIQSVPCITVFLWKELRKDLVV